MQNDEENDVSSAYIVEDINYPFFEKNEPKDYYEHQLNGKFSDLWKVINSLVWIRIFFMTVSFKQFQLSYLECTENRFSSTKAAVYLFV